MPTTLRKHLRICFSHYQVTSRSNHNTSSTALDNCFGLFYDFQEASRNACSSFYTRVLVEFLVTICGTVIDKMSYWDKLVCSFHCLKLGIFLRTFFTTSETNIIWRRCSLWHICVIWILSSSSTRCEPTTATTSSTATSSPVCSTSAAHVWDILLPGNDAKSIRNIVD